MSDLTWDVLERMWKSLPPNPVAPENRNLAKLQPSSSVPRGHLLRFVVDNRRPYIVIHPSDIKELRKMFSGPLGAVPDQYIADIAEQLFAEWEAKKVR